MKLAAIILAILVTRANTRYIEENEDGTACDGVMIKGVYHEKEVLKTDLDRPYLLAMDRASDNLYFSYSRNDNDTQTARLDINTKEFELITGVTDGFAQTVDPKTQDVYIGGSDGIYKYDHKNKIAELYAGAGKDVWTMFFKDVLYFIEFPSHFLYVVSNGEIIRFTDLEDTEIDNFIIDKGDTMFYSNASGLYSQQKGIKMSVLVKESGSLSIRGITADVYDNVYLCVNDGIYIVKKLKAELEKVVDIDDAFGLEFDSHNNIIYADGSDLVILKPNKNKSC